MKNARRVVFGITVGVWLALCWAFWMQLIRNAAASGDVYARTASFQLMNFAVQYLWGFLLLLAVALLLEWAVFRMIGAFASGRRRADGVKPVP